MIVLFMLLFQSCGCGNFRELDTFPHHIPSQISSSPILCYSQYYLLTVAARSSLDRTQPKYRAGIPDVGEAILIAVHTCGSFLHPLEIRQYL